MRYFGLITSMTLLFSNCSEKMTNNVNPDDPANLALTALVYDDGSGIVVADATANNAVEYQFDMGEEDSDIIVSVSGNVEYTYKTAGIYTIQVKAFGASGRFMKASKQVNVVGEEPVSVGEGYSTPIEYEDYNLLWNDEFNGTNLDQSIWSYQNGDGCPNLCGWGNNELEWYRPENSQVANGVFTITAKKENHQGRQYTSTKVITQNKKAMLYGRADIRAIMPKGKGLWPAIWMLGTNINSVGWPKCGEIDIMEMVGGNNMERRVSGNMFWYEDGTRDEPRGHTLEEGFLYDKYHVYSVIWTEESVKWLIDDIQYHELSITEAARSEFHSPFYMILNVAVGGNWPGSPDETTVFPTSMAVDYVRVFEPK